METVLPRRTSQKFSQWLRPLLARVQHTHHLDGIGQHPVDHHVVRPHYEFARALHAAGLVEGRALAARSLPWPPTPRRARSRPGRCPGRCSPVGEGHRPPPQLELGAAQRDDLAAALPAGLAPAFLSSACRRAAMSVRAWSLLTLGLRSSNEACTCSRNQAS
jgi:hypothetical protein